jgi:hypothetical protein
MSSIKLHLEAAEYDAVARFASALKTTPEAVLYSALNRLMLDAINPTVRSDILDTMAWRPENLPLWADSAHSVHAYEGQPDDDPSPSRYA